MLSDYVPDKERKLRFYQKIRYFSYFYLHISIIFRTFAALLVQKKGNDMQGFKKSIEFYTDKKYRDLEYGTIYYVPGTSSQILDAYLCTHADEIAARLNDNGLNWVSCHIDCLDKENPLFAHSQKPTLHSAMLPTNDTLPDAYSFLKASLEITDPDIMEKALSEYFHILQQMFDEILDDGAYSPYLLSGTILSPLEDEIRFSVSNRESCFEANYPHTNECLDLPCAAAEEETGHFDYPSRLEITPNTYQILLPDYHREIKFYAQTKALYVLFLNHPEGIRMKEIGDYKEEYKTLYLYFSNRDNVERLRDSVEKLLDVLSPSALNVKKSQCNKALKSAIPEDNLRRYYEIEVHPGQPHKISLDRSLVSMPDFLHKT